MNLLKNILVFITQLASKLRKNEATPPMPTKARPQDLPPEIMAKVMSEAAQLKKNHAVEVKNLASGEQPSEPKEV